MKETTMFLGAYHFRGDPADLLAGHDLLLAVIPEESLHLHLVVTRPFGITVLDACPTRSVFEDFSTSPALLTAVADAGLPVPRVEPLGEVAGSIITRTEAAP